MSVWKGDVDPVSKTRPILLESGFDTLPARFNVDFNNIKEGEKIGDGLWGPVFKADWLGRKVAVKKFAVDSTFHNVSLMAKEVKPMLTFRHPNILKLFGFYLLAQSDLVLQCSMIMELMDCDLDKYIEERRGVQKQDGGLPLSNDEGLYIISEIARGMNHMHNCGYFHQDLKPKNVLLKRSDVFKFHVDVKIADFGTSGLMGGSSCNRNAGTTQYKAPEQFDNTKTLKPDKIDVYSFGVLCSKLLTGEEPYNGLIGNKLIQHICKGGTPAIPKRDLPNDVVGVIKQCLNKKPEKRPNFQKICDTLEPALQKVWNTPVSVATSASVSSQLEGLESDQEQLSIVDKIGLPMEYKDYVILPQEVKVLRQIGGGIYNVIYEVEWKGTHYALKQPIFAFHGLNQLTSIPFRKMLPMLVHKNIVIFFGYYPPSGKLSSDPGCIMELLQDDLLDIIQDSVRMLGGKSSPFSEEVSRYIMKEIAEGMVYLHGMGILHRDLKPANVLISRLQDIDQCGMVVKLTDFSGDDFCMTTLYAAPEILNQKPRGKEAAPAPIDIEALNNGKKADVYSFAITCSEILGADIGFGGRDLWEFRKAVMGGERPKWPGVISQDLNDQIKRCWHQDPNLRPDFSEICKILIYEKLPAVQQPRIGRCICM